MAIEIKAIVIRHPYWKEIADGAKTIEYRSWQTRFRGWLAIVAARQRESRNQAGHVVCFVPLKDCVEAGFKDYEWMLGSPVAPMDRIEIPGRLGLFDVTDKIPEKIKSQLDARGIATVSVSKIQPNAEKLYPLHEAAAKGELRAVKALLRENPTLAFTKDRKGNTPLHYATAKSNKEVADFLLRLYLEQNTKKLGSHRKG